MSAFHPAHVDILGMGIVTVDDFLYVDHFPDPDTKVRVRLRVRRCGGLTGNALIAAALLGSRCSYAGSLAGDELSEFVRATLSNSGIDLTWLDPIRQSPPIHSTIVVDDSNASRTILFELPEDRRYGGDWPPEELIGSSRVLFVDHHDAERTLRAMRLARAAGVAVVADFERDEGPQFSELLAVPDHLILSEGFAIRLAHSTDPRAWFAMLHGPQRCVTVVTCGAFGGWFQTQDEEAPKQFPGHSVEARDTTACGDVFHGAYASAIARGDSLEAAILFANAAAALKATGSGIIETVVHRENVERFLRGR